MCRLSAIGSGDYFPPMENILALETMKEGHDGSGLGLMLKALGGVFSDYKNYPVLSGIFSNAGLEALDRYMMDAGFKAIFAWQPKIKPVADVKRRDHYLAKVFDYPDEFKD